MSIECPKCHHENPDDTIYCGKCSRPLKLIKPEIALECSKMTGRKFMNAVANGQEDILQGKVWAYLDEKRHMSKRQKDLTDIVRLMEAYPLLRSRVPARILKKFE